MQRKSERGAIEPRLHAELMRNITKMDPELLTRVVRMLNLLSALLNVVEEYSKHRVRQSRVNQMERGEVKELWMGSFHEAFTQLKNAGVSASELQVNNPPSPSTLLVHAQPCCTVFQFDEPAMMSCMML